jgi:hypothetical protein
VYSTCLFCNRDLGTNEVIEPFPVGRRLAFDPAKGRLWVVCRKCERWNLSPLEERWEAFEECERRFRATRLRVSTDNIGLARLKEGLELVRVGEPLRPEFAAWRYGDQFGRRRRRAVAYGVAGGVALGALAAGAIAAGAGAAFLPQIPNLLINIPVRVKIKTQDGKVVKLRYGDLQKARFLVDSGTDRWVVQLGKRTFEGDEAERVSGLLLAGVNRMAGSKQAILNAVGQIESAGDPERYLSQVAHELRYEARTNSGGGFFARKPGLVHKMPTPKRLALEMALHEEQEMRAMAGELLDLELQWRQAEEIANIADNMFVPQETHEFIEKHRPPAGMASDTATGQASED